MTSLITETSGQSGLSASVINQFKTLIGAHFCLTTPSEVASYCKEARNKFFGKCSLVLKPGSTREVSDVVALANALNIAIVPQGGNTGLVGGQIPDSSGRQIILSTERLNHIRSLDADSNVVIVEAGVILETLQNAADEAGRMFPLALGAQGSCQIGGNLSTNAGGTSVLAYGNTRDMVLGLEVVLPDGRIWNGLRSLRKDNTGYDLKHLFIGAEGTLGVITAASLKLYPKPRDQQVSFAGLETPDQALALFNLARAHAGSMLTGFELIPRIGMEFAFSHLPDTRDPMAETHPWYCLIELSIGSDAVDGRALIETILEEAFEAGLIGDAVLAENTRQAQDFWRIRHGLSEVQKHEGGSIKHDISVPVSAIPRFLERAMAACEAAIPGCRLVPFGHMGDGNLHFNISQPIGADQTAYLARWEEINALVHAIVADMGGSISAEHGIGTLKRDLLPDVKDLVEMELMAQIKTTLDPKGLMNPGKVLQMVKANTKDTKQ
ncbi:FAD-binding oxidoreductase [Cohaesibacter celericrescens]|uniref:FAD-binding oxidoreductase n=1 Tax=Cohaesibacter celericrescens TaxID=2067669 RepID=UPI001FE01DFC|nr:FAD-binding oxidoreductase [Cohaesibacter celericrescens]